MSDLVQLTAEELSALRALLSRAVPMPPAAMPAWGAVISVGNKRPIWLNRDDAPLIQNLYGSWITPSDKSCKNSHDYAWYNVRAIRLPADHPYYVAADKGFTYWPGGENAPDDWDGGDVLRRGDPETSRGRHSEPWVAPYSHNQRWTRYDLGRSGYFSDIIGYRKRVEPAFTPLADRIDPLIATSKRNGWANVALWLSIDEAERLIGLLRT